MEIAIPVKQKGKFLLEGRGLILFLAFLITFIGVVALANRFYHFTHYTATQASPVVMVAAPGQKIFLTFNLGNSLNSDWGSPGGLRITLNSPVGFSSQVVTPQEPDWSGFMQTSNSAGDPMIITGSFTVPTPDNPASSTLTGQISGDILYPDPDPSGIYHDQIIHVAIPVSILLISPSAIFSSEQLPLYTVSGAGILLMLLIPVLFRVYDTRRKSVPWV